MTELNSPSNPSNTLIREVDGVYAFIMPENLEFDTTKLPDIIVVDEITHFSNPEILLLNEIRTRTGKVDVIGLGDTNQMGYQLKIGDRFMNFGLVGINAIQAPPLKLSIRAANESQRINMDLLVSLNNEISKILTRFPNRLEANSKIDEFLINTNTVTSLDYYLDDSEIKGTYITDGYNTTDFNRVKNIIQEKGRNFIILTETGELSDDYIKVLQDVGLYENGQLNENIAVKDGNELLEEVLTKQIQGSEVDHIIFDSDIINKYPDVKDKMKAFYTYASRSKEGSTVIGKEGLAQTKLVNAEMSQHPPIVYQPLVESTINELKEKRIAELKSYLGEDTKLSQTGFTWDGTTEVTEDSTKDSTEDPTEKTNFLLASEVRTPITREGPIDPDTNGKKGLLKIEEDTIIRRTEKGKTFGVMLHSFYNNLGIEGDKFNLTEIVVNRENPSTDLNGIKNVSDRKHVDVLLKEWANFKTDALFGNINNDEYTNYLNHIFGVDFNNNRNELNKINTT